jgi:ribosome-binding factor A
MPTHRRERANDYILRELTQLLTSRVHDPRAEKIRFTGVDLTVDRRIARIYVACYSGEEDLREGLTGLESAKSFLRHELSRLLHWPFTPEIEFRVDRSWEHGAKVDNLLRELGNEHGDGTGQDTKPE